MNKHMIVAGIGLFFLIFGITYLNYLNGETGTGKSSDFGYCALTTDPSPSILNSTEVFQNTINVTESVVRPGDEITTNLTIKNITNKALGLTLSPLNYGWDFNQQPQGDSFVLQPGEEIKITWTARTERIGPVTFMVDANFWYTDSATDIWYCELAYIGVFVVNTFGLSIGSIKLISYGSLVIGLLILFFIAPRLIKNNLSGISVFLANGAILLTLLIPFAVGHFLSIFVKIGYYTCSWGIFIWGFAYIVAFVMGRVYIKRFVPKLGRARAILIGATAASIIGFLAGTVMGWPGGC